MRKVLYFLGEFNDQDIDWIVGTAARTPVKQGETVVVEGRRVETVSIVITGKLTVMTGKAVVAEIGSGEVVGEMSFLDSRPPSASVVAKEDSLLLSIPTTRLAGKLKSDLGFASRFYKALGVLLAFRLRDSTAQMAYGREKRLDQEFDANEVDPDMLDRISLAALRFDRIIQGALS
ncbi:MAG: cyclic nucleotide-binding domain-containing protein [Pirellulaceae bacterium]